ncbi:MAG: hypothetical protein HY735_03015 [Verrucomicrobia bacterium]|nr:hypothetical protein [Verrucomicrobiota bacterium]
MSTHSANLVDAPRRSQEEIAELRVYEAMSGAVISSLQQFLQPFQSTPDSTYVLKAMTREDFFPKFHRLAHELAQDCCSKLVTIIQSSSRVALVRGTAPSDLAGRIRVTAFQPLEEILAQYAGVAKKIGVLSRNIKAIRDALEQAEAGASSGDRNAEDRKAESGGATVKPWATEAELRRQEASLLQAQAQAFTRMAQYFKRLNEFPVGLLSYACDKCYAGEVNYPLQLEQVARIQAEIRGHLTNAMETLARVSTAAKQELEQEQASHWANVQLAEADQALERICEGKFEAKLKAEQRFRKGVILALVCLLVMAVGLCAFLFAQR